MLLNCQNQLDSVRCMVKMRQDNNVIGCKGPLYAKHKIEL